MPGKHKSMAYKKEGPFKMKGSPMQRNFGIGSPMRQSAGTRDPKTEKPIVKGLKQGIKEVGKELKVKKRKTINVPKDHPVTPPKTTREDTVKGKTHFQTDMIPVSNVIKQGVKGLKGIYVDPVVKNIKKIRKYFTEK